MDYQILKIMCYKFISIKPTFEVLDMIYRFIRMIIAQPIKWEHIDHNEAPKAASLRLTPKAALQPLRPPTH